MVRGRVQMVGFRQFVVERARALGLSGWVRNGEDGATVEVVAEGPDEALSRLEELLHEGPRLAHVDSVLAERSEKLEGESGFHVRW